MFKKITDSYFYELIFYFLIYSFMGWCLEISVLFIQNGYYMQRGFIIGPFCIIYGFAILLLITLLKPLKSKTLLFFICSTIIISFLEYITGFTLEALFGRRWWDYSNIPLNLQGYISLKNSIIWGILATIILKYYHPKLELFIKRYINTSSYSSKVSSFSFVILAFFIINIFVSILYNL